ncbi:hypothetical protein HMPREF2534_01937 [Bacteroides thetaiotaomicron]|nr:hypothetical protein HMPREF2534_01937 [Bacteroides thetaiotaomicron]GKH20360.1 hypothetical protein CE91St8_20950 [Bacteroides thetaiotaomicron]GKH67724.1 hypothetical protein CE91St9_23970 [Bacteroides thetaiotaomicron]
MWQKYEKQYDIHKNRGLILYNQSVGILVYDSRHPGNMTRGIVEESDVISMILRQPSCV